MHGYFTYFIFVGPEGHPLAQPEEIEEEAVTRACTLAKQANVPLYICSPTSAGAADIIKEAREKGQVVIGEPSAAAITLDGSHYFNKCWEHAAAFVTSPPLRDDPNTPNHLRNSLAHDGLQMVGSDNCTYSTEVKELGKNNFTTIPHGLNGIEDRMSIVYERLVQEGKMKMTRFVEVTSTAAAKAHNLFPKKGCIAEGSDADIVIWNPNNFRTITQQTQKQVSPFNVFEGVKVTGAAEFVIAKGKIAVAEYQLNAIPGTGEFVETPTFPPELYDKVQDIDYAKKVAPVEREPIAVEANTNGSSSQEANDSFGKTTPRGYCAEQVGRHINSCH